MFSRRRGNKIADHRWFWAEYRDSKNTYLLFLLLFNFAYYLICIIRFPDYSSDDFYLIAKLNGSLMPVPAAGPEIFFLDVRPVFWFFFKTSYGIFNGNPFLMKMLSLALHLILVAVLFYLVYGISAYFKKDTAPVAVMLAVLLFSVHPDAMLYIIYLNNATELLMVLFYAAALLVLVNYLNGRVSGILFLPAVLLFFLLSIFSKQTGIHLPFVVLLVYFYLTLKGGNNFFRLYGPAVGGAGLYKKFVAARHTKNLCGADIGEVSTVKMKTLLSASVIMILFTAVFAYINYTMYWYGNLDAATIFKKPFSMAGTLLFVVFPFIAEGTYLFFLFNKPAAYIIALIICICAAAYISRHNRAKWIFHGVLFVLVLFFPRAALLGGGRINTHLIMWLVIFCGFLIQGRGKYTHILFTIYLTAMMIYSYNVATTAIRIQNIRDKQISQLYNLLNLTSVPNAFIALSGSVTFQYEFNYKLNSKMLKTKIEWNPLYYKYLFPSMEMEKEVIKCFTKGYKVICRTIDSKVFINNNPIYGEGIKYRIKPIGNFEREHKNYLLFLNSKIFHNCVVLIHNGLNWRIIH